MKSPNSVQTLANEVKAYSEIVSEHGPNSSQALDFRQKHLEDQEFTAFADSLDQFDENWKIQSKKVPNQPEYSRFDAIFICLGPNSEAPKQKQLDAMTQLIIHPVLRACRIGLINCLSRANRNDLLGEYLPDLSTIQLKGLAGFFNEEGILNRLHRFAGSPAFLNAANEALLVESNGTLNLPSRNEVRSAGVNEYSSIAGAASTNIDSEAKFRGRSFAYAVRNRMHGHPKFDEDEVAQDATLTARKRVGKQTKNGVTITWEFNFKGVAWYTRNAFCDLIDHHFGRRKTENQADVNARSIFGGPDDALVVNPHGNPDDDPALTIERQELVEFLLLKIRDSVSSLEEQERQIFFLRAVEGKTFREIGDDCSLSDQRARQIYVRTEMKLREYFKGLEGLSR